MNLVFTYIACIKRVIGPTVGLGVVVKNNAYGHGLSACGVLGQGLSAVTYFFTAGTREAVELRKAGITKPICAFSYRDCSIDECIDNAIEVVVLSKKEIKKVAVCAALKRKVVYVHIKIETGMSRLGIWHDEVISCVHEILNTKWVKLRGVMTHLADAYGYDTQLTTFQLTTFHHTVAMLKKLVPYAFLVHACSSGAITFASHYGHD